MKNASEKQIQSSILRRDFLGMGLFSLASSFILPKSILTANKKHELLLAGSRGYFVESGQFRKSGIQCVGLLEVHNSAFNSFSSIMDSLRTSNNFHSPLSYRSTNHHKIAFTQNLIDALIAENAVKMYVKIFDQTDYDFDISRFSFQMMKYAQGYQILLSNSNVNPNHISVKEESLWGPNQHFRRLQNSNNPNFSPITARTNNFLQLADFLVGSVFADNTGYVEREENNSTKAGLIQYLRNQLGVSKLDYSNLANNFKLQVLE